MPLTGNFGNTGITTMHHPNHEVIIQTNQQDITIKVVSFIVPPVMVN